MHRIFGIIILFFSVSLNAQLDLEHWFPPIFKTGGDVSNVQISLTTDKEVPFRVFIYDGDKLITQVVLSRDLPVEYIIDAELDSVLTSLVSDTMKPKEGGLHLVGENSFYANLKYFGANTEIISSKGKSALGKSFFIVNDQNILYGENPNPMNYQASIMAYSDNTKIKISNLNNKLIFTNGQKYDELNITLNKNQYFILAALKRDNTTSEMIDYYDPNLIGASITSDKPIVITNGNFLSQDSGEKGGSLNVDQSLPIDNLGKEYLLINGMSAGNFYMEKAMIVATEDNTDIFFNDDTKPIFSLKKGEYYMGPNAMDKKFISGSEPSFINEEGRMIPTSSTYIRSNKPIYCYQLLATFHDNPPPKQAVFQVGRTSAMLMSYPIDKEYQVKEVMLANIDQLADYKMRSKLSIKSEDDASITVNGQALIGGTKVKGKENWKYNTIQNLKGDVIIKSTKSLNVDFVGGSADNYSGYAGSVVSYSNDPILTNNGNCLEEGVYLSITNSVFDHIQWQRDNVDIVGANSSTYMPTMEGLYSCVLTYSGVVYRTNSILIKHCPYVVSDKVYDNVCDKIVEDNFHFLAPHDTEEVASFDILTQALNGKVIIDKLSWVYTPNEDFFGQDRFVYQICNKSKSYCETWKVNVNVNERPKADVLDKLYSIKEIDDKKYYDLTLAIVDIYGNQDDFYEDSDLQQSISNPSLFITNLKKVFLKVSSASGCFKVFEIDLLVKEKNFLLSNAFTPNNDGINDYWDYNILSSLNKLDLSIIDVYGKLVYKHKKEYVWNGKDFQNKQLPSNAYWVVYSYEENGQIKSKNQWLYLKN